MCSTFDEKSFDLAEHFLADHRELLGRAGELACVIQEAVEGWLLMEAVVEAQQREPFDIRKLANEILGTALPTYTIKDGPHRLERTNVNG